MTEIQTIMTDVHPHARLNLVMSAAHVMAGLYPGLMDLVHRFAEMAYKGDPKAVTMEMQMIRTPAITIVRF